MNSMPLLVLVLLVGEPPQAPPVVKLPQAPPVIAPKKYDYAACLEAVDRGETVYLAVGKDSDEKFVYSVKELPGRDAGYYKCWKNGKLKQMQRVDPKTLQPLVMEEKPVVGVADPNADHKCPNPNCGAYQFVQSSQQGDGSHTHTCAQCGTSWRHGGSLGYPGTRGQSVNPTYVQPFGGVQVGAGFQFQFGRFPAGSG